MQRQTDTRGEEATKEVTRKSVTRKSAGAKPKTAQQVNTGRFTNTTCIKGNKKLQTETNNKNYIYIHMSAFSANALCTFVSIFSISAAFSPGNVLWKWHK